MRLIDADVLKQHIDKLPALPDGNFAGNHSALKTLINMQPTIESSTNCSEIQNSSDCISRQAAIDCLGFTWPEDAIRNLPSAQPEIIRCKDCRYYNSEEKECLDLLGHGRRWEENDFCSYAERREVTE